MSSSGRRNEPAGAGPAGAERAPRLPLTDEYRRIRGATAGLCEPLAPEDLVVQSMPDASPAKWHLAHTTWFFEEFVLRAAVDGYRPHRDEFRYLFNSYYNSVGPMHRRPQRGLLTRPNLSEVQAYREQVDENVLRILERDSLPPDAREVLVLGLHHEQQHQELLLTDIKHLFACNPLHPAYTKQPPQAPRAAPALSFTGYPGGLVEIGHSGAGFCFDNEQPRHRVHLEPFQLANRAVTNAEYLEFIRGGGYGSPACWLSDGWATVQQEGWERPIYWMPTLEEEFSLTGVRALDPHAPVSHLSYYEADAFARWAGERLPTETEWEIAAAEVACRGNFVEGGHWHPLPAPYPTPGSTAPQPPLQMFGDVWEWTQSPYTSYPGFAPLRGALGEYNGKFMVNQLVLRGGSCATATSHIRATYRNFFNPAARWQFSGLRLARSAQ